MTMTGPRLPRKTCQPRESEGMTAISSRTMAFCDWRTIIPITNMTGTSRHKQPMKSGTIATAHNAEASLPPLAETAKTIMPANSAPTKTSIGSARISDNANIRQKYGILSLNN